MPSSNCCFLTCIQISQEAGEVVWYSHLFKNFPQFIVIHTVKGFGIVNKAEIDVFLELSCLFDGLEDVIIIFFLIDGKTKKEIKHFALSVSQLIIGDTRTPTVWFYSPCCKPETGKLQPTGWIWLVAWLYLFIFKIVLLPWTNNRFSIFNLSHFKWLLKYQCNVLNFSSLPHKTWISGSLKKTCANYSKSNL